MSLVMPFPPRRSAPMPPALRRKLEAAVERLIATLDALDAPDEDLEEGHDAEAFADDAEPNLGSTNHKDQSKATNTYFGGDDLEFEGETVAECDLEDGHDREDDPAESGIADDDGYREQLVGEPSLGATQKVDQRVAWRSGGGVFDGEASGTEDDLASSRTADAWKADRAAVDQAREQLHGIARRKSARAPRVLGLPFLGTVNR